MIRKTAFRLLVGAVLAGALTAAALPDGGIPQPPVVDAGPHEDPVPPDVESFVQRWCSDVDAGGHPLRGTDLADCITNARHGHY